MEAVYVALCIFSGFLNSRFTSACVSDDDCYWSGSQCCKYTENGKYLENGVCVYDHRPCNSICRSQDDCFWSKRCDVPQFQCTTECFSDDHCYQIYGDSEYVCSYNEAISQNQCIKRDNNDIYSDSTNDDDSSDDIVKFVLIISAVISFCVCCCCVKMNQRSIRRAGQMATGNAHNPVTTVQQQNEDAETLQTLQMNSIQTPPELNGPNLDAIAVSGPPSYVEVGDVPEVPPPTYEEAVGV